MKKIISISLLTVLFMTSGYSQDGNLKKQTYFRFGYSIPTWKFYGFDSKTDWPDEIKRTGVSFEIGNIFMLNSIKLSPGMRLGINIDYLSLNYNRFSQPDIISENFIMAGSKIGPSFSYSPVKRLVFDAYFKFNPVWAAGNFRNYTLESAEDQFYLGFMGIKYSVGMNVRYSVLMAGIELNPGYLRKMRLFDDENAEFTDIYMENVNDNGNKVPAPVLNLTLGLSF